MKYRLFTAADPSDSKKIGSADTVNFLPEINKQGQLCWRSRPGLLGGWDFTGSGVASLLLTKSTTTESYSNVDDIIHYRYEITNTGSIDLNIPYAVTDDKVTVDFPQTPVVLSPNESIVCVEDYIVIQADIDAESVTNIATATAYNGEVLVTSNSDTVTVNYLYVPPPIEGCDHNVIMASQEGYAAWDVIDNETGNYSCTPTEDEFEIRLRTDFATGTKKTCYFVIRFSDVSVGGYGWTLYLDIYNGDLVTFTPFPTVPEGYAPPTVSTLCYVNIDDDRGHITFETGNPVSDPTPPTAGTVYIECIMIVERDWEVAGEDLETIYDENGDPLL